MVPSPNESPGLLVAITMISFCSVLSSVADGGVHVAVAVKTPGSAIANTSLVGQVVVSVGATVSERSV